MKTGDVSWLFSRPSPAKPWIRAVIAAIIVTSAATESGLLLTARADGTNTWQVGGFTAYTNVSEEDYGNDWPWSWDGSASCTVSSAYATDNYLYVSASGSADSWVNLDEDSVNGGNYTLSSFSGVVQATWTWTGDPGSAPSTHIETWISASGSLLTTNQLAPSDENIYARTYSRSSGTVDVSASGAGTNLATAGLNNNYGPTISNGTFTDTNSDYLSYSPSPGFQAEATADFTLYYNGNYYTAAGSGTITCGCQVAGGSYAEVDGDDPVRMTGYAEGYVNLSGYSEIKVDF